MSAKNTKALAFFAFLIIWLFCNQKLSAQGVCNNVDFEDGNFTNWTGYTGGGFSAGGCCPISTPTPGIINDRQTIMTGPGFDPIIPQIPMVSPYGGVYSVKLGNSDIGAEAEKLVYQMKVTAANPNFTYQYAVILEDPGHLPSEQPRFQVDIMDSTGTTIPCGFYNVVSGGGIPGFQTSVAGYGDTIRWKNWSLVAVDLTAYIGHTVTVEFQTGDCSLGGHYGYAYIDGSCFPLEIITNYCPGDTSATLMAPTGFQQYKWSTGDTSQSITIIHPTYGDSATVLCTPYQGGSCATLLKYYFSPFPPVSANYTVNTSCGNSEVILKDSSVLMAPGAQFIGWQWLVNDTLVSRQEDLTYGFPGPGNYKITFIAQSNAGCPDTASKFVNVPQGLTPVTSLPKVNAYNGYGVSCNTAADGMAVVTIQYGVPPYSIMWSTTPAITKDTAANLSSGTYTVKVSDSTGCYAIDTVKIIPPPLIYDTAIITNIACSANSSDSGSIQLQTSGGVGNLLYSWSNDSTLNSTSNNNLQAGNYSVTITDLNNCSVFSTFAITKLAQSYAINSTVNNVGCFGQCNGSINVNLVGNNPPYTFTWNSTAVNTSFLQNLCAASYFCTITDNSSCVITDSFLVAENVQLSSELAHSDLICGNDSNGVVSVTPHNGTPPYSYSWNTPPGSSGAQIVGLVAGVYMVTITDAGGCSVSDTATVTSPPIITLAPVIKNIDCNGDNSGNISLNATGGTGSLSYQWSNNFNLNSPNNTNLPAGGYIATITDNSNCAVNYSAQITQPALPFNIADSVVNVPCYNDCQGSIGLLVTGNTPPYTYMWNTTPSANSPLLQNLCATVYKCTVTDINHCTISGSYTITQPDSLHLTIASTDVICAGDSSGSVSVTASGGTAPYTYVWNAGGNNAAINPAAVGNYTCTVSDNNTCSSTTAAVVNGPIIPLAVAQFTCDSVNCYGYNDGSISLKATGGTPSYIYTLNGNVSNSTGEFGNLPEGPYTLIITDKNNCTIATQTIVNQPGDVLVLTDPDSVTLNLGESKTINVTCNYDPYAKYRWSALQGLECDTCNQIIIAPTQSGQYIVYGTIHPHNKDCEASAKTDVTVIPKHDIYIPNAFTPNGDGNNDYFEFFGNKPAIKSVNVKVFDRIGELVFESDDINFKWDGIYKGHALNPAVFVYEFRFVFIDNTVENNYIGSVTLLR